MTSWDYQTGMAKVTTQLGSLTPTLDHKNLATRTRQIPFHLMPYVRGINIRLRAKMSKTHNHFLAETGYSDIGDSGDIGNLPILMASLISLPKEAVTPRPTSRYELEQEVENLLPDMDYDDFDELRYLAISL